MESLLGGKHMCLTTLSPFPMLGPHLRMAWQPGWQGPEGKQSSPGPAPVPSLIHASFFSLDTPLSKCLTSHAWMASWVSRCFPGTSLFSYSEQSACMVIRGVPQSEPDPTILKHSNLLPPPCCFKNEDQIPDCSYRAR